MINHVELSVGLGGTSKSKSRAEALKRFRERDETISDRFSGNKTGAREQGQESLAFDRPAPSGKVFVTVCAWCEKTIRKGDDRYDTRSWKPAKPFTMGGEGIVLTHGICPACMKRLCNEMELVVP